MALWIVPQELRPQLARMSEARKRAWQDPAVRARMSEARKRAWQDPAVRARFDAGFAAAMKRRMLKLRAAAVGPEASVAGAV